MTVFFSFFKNVGCHPRSDPCNGYYDCKGDKKVCKVHYYGDSCKRYCKPERLKGRNFICDIDGYPICYKYWFGKDCSIFCKEMHTRHSSYTCTSEGKKNCTEGNKNSL